MAPIQASMGSVPNSGVSDSSARPRYRSTDSRTTDARLVPRRAAWYWSSLYVSSGKRRFVVIYRAIAISRYRKSRKKSIQQALFGGGEVGGPVQDDGGGHHGVSAEPLVPRPPDFPHPARAQWGRDFVRTKPLIRGKRHRQELPAAILDDYVATKYPRILIHRPCRLRRSGFLAVTDRSEGDAWARFRLRGKRRGVVPRDGISCSGRLLSSGRVERLLKTFRQAEVEDLDEPLLRSVTFSV